MQNNASENLREKKDNHFNLKYQDDSLRRIFFGVIIIWLGLSFLLMEHGYFYSGEWWSYFLLGLGIIFLAEAIIRISQPEYKRHYTGKIIAGVILVAIGAGSIYSMEKWWPLILIAVGIIIILLSVQQKNKS